MDRFTRASISVESRFRGKLKPRTLIIGSLLVLAAACGKDKDPSHRDDDGTGGAGNDTGGTPSTGEILRTPVGELRTPAVALRTPAVVLRTPEVQAAATRRPEAWAGAVAMDRVGPPTISTVKTPGPRAPLDTEAKEGQVARFLSIRPRADGWKRAVSTSSAPTTRLLI